MINQVSNSKFISIDPKKNIIKMISKFSKQYIENEIIMLNYLSKFDIPTPHIIDYNERTGEMTQKYYTNTTLFKLYSSPLIKFSPKVLYKIENITKILRDQKIFIDDFQFVYNDQDVILIDPGGVYHLLTAKSKGFIFSCIQNPIQSFKKKTSEVENGFICQMKRLQNILIHK